MCVCYTSLCTAALLKCAFIVAGIVDYPSNVPLAKQLEMKLGSGVELTTIAKVPIGSGKTELGRIWGEKGGGGHREHLPPLLRIFSSS